MSLRHELARQHWPADLSDRDTVVSVFQVYSASGHVAVVRNRNSEFWFGCNCGASISPVRADNSNHFRDVLDKVEGLADQHIEQTR
ncbi:hypothetical protein AB0D10_05255 [Kitasatospora sp. NPDC048545]|uniref:hypothetical protein n=1 Tax=Kitasatospora sp. NPDC048545 TaxID=3157208 RepID=UPI00340E82E7